MRIPIPTGMGWEWEYDFFLWGSPYGSPYGYPHRGKSYSYSHPIPWVWGSILGNSMSKPSNDFTTISDLVLKNFAHSKSLTSLLYPESYSSFHWILFEKFNFEFSKISQKISKSDIFEICPLQTFFNNFSC